MSLEMWLIIILLMFIAFPEFMGYVVQFILIIAVALGTYVFIFGGHV